MEGERLIKLSQVLVVEGKYDKIKCSQIFDCTIIETNGFGIYKDKDRLNMLKKLAKSKGLIILTDSDAAGFKIRNYLISSIGKQYIQNIYVPDLFGKEKRKAQQSKEGKLGVEGVNDKIILDAFNKAGILLDSPKIEISDPITKTDLYLDGLSGTDESANKRRALLNYLHLPARLSSNSLVSVLNELVTKKQYKDILNKIFGEEETY